MPAVNPSPFSSKPTFVDPLTGAIANGYQLFTYLAGSVNTKQATYTDFTGTVANTNPIILDTAGQPTNVQLWLTQGQAYKFLLATPTDSDPPTNGFVLGDFLRGINDTSASAVTSEWLAAPAPAFISGTQFSMGGDQTSNFQVDRRVQTQNTGGTVYGLITAVVFSGGITTVTIVPDSGTLDAGLSAVSYGILSALNRSYTDVDIQNFTASGNWTKVGALARTVYVEAIGAGGGSGGGAGGAAASQRNGGGGGGGGAYAKAWFRASDLTSTVVVTIGTGGGAGTAGVSGNATTGADGGNTTFGSFLTAFGGGGGQGGTGVTGSGTGGGGGGTGGKGQSGNGTSGTTGGAPSTASDTAGMGGGGGGSSALNNVDGRSAEYGGGGGGSNQNVNAVGKNGGSSIYAAGGGGSGGGVSSGNSQSAGGAGGISGSFTSGGGGTAGGTGGVAGGAGAAGTSPFLGSGGGGGGGNSAGTGGAGANGGVPGGGAGGGGGGTTTGGAGAVGARGECRVYTYF